MAEVYATKNGNWTDPTVWSTGTLPLSDDDVYANGFTVLINLSSIRVASISTGRGNIAAIGGNGNYGFRLTNNCSLTANVFANRSTCLRFVSASPNSCSVFGNIELGSIENNDTGSTTMAGIENTSTGSVTIYGNVEGGNGRDMFGVNNSSTGNVTIYGNIQAGRNTRNYGLVNTGTATVYGNINAGIIGGTDNYGTINSGTLNVFGNVVGGVGGSARFYGILNQAGGRLFILGNINGARGVGSFGSSTNQQSIGVLNQSTNTIRITGTVQGTFNIPAFWNDASPSDIIIYGGVVGPSIAYRTGGPPGGSNSYNDVERVVSIINNSTGTITVFGNVSGGAISNSVAIDNVTTGRIIVYGESRGGMGNQAHGIINRVNNGYVFVQKAVGSGFGAGSSSSDVPFPSFFAAGLGLVNLAISGQCFVEEIETGLRGQFPTSGIIFLSSGPNTKAVLRDDAGRQYTLFSSAPTFLVPLSSDVRFRTTYNNNSLTGSLGMPQPNQVNFGVPVDNSTGTAVFDSNSVFQLPVSAIGEQGSMGARIKLVATNNSVQRIINNLNQ